MEELLLKIRQKAEELGISLASMGISEETFEEDTVKVALEFLWENLEDVSSSAEDMELEENLYEADEFYNFIVNEEDFSKLKLNKKGE